MHIVVALKQVHDPNTPPVLLRIGEGGRTLELPAGMSPTLNGYDANAVEVALKLKEACGGTVTVFSVGDDSTKNILRRALGMGADRAVHISGPSGLNGDSHSIAMLLGAAVRKLPGADLVLCGRQASDSDAGQVLFSLAEQLNLPAVSPVKFIQRVERDFVIVDRMADHGIQRVRVTLPALLGVSSEINKPRTASLKGVMSAKRAEIPTWTQGDLGIEELVPALILCRLYIEGATDSSAEMVPGISAREIGRALADRLHQEGLI